MKNWSGVIRWKPAEIKYPDSEEAIQSIVREALASGQRIRMIGSGHSFVPLSKTDEVLVSLDNYQGLLSLFK